MEKYLILSHKSNEQKEKHTNCWRVSQKQWKILEKYKYKYNGQNLCFADEQLEDFTLVMNLLGETYRNGEEKEKERDRQTQRQRTEKESVSNSILSNSSQFTPAASNKSDILSNAMGRNE